MVVHFDLKHNVKNVIIFILKYIIWQKANNKFFTLLLDYIFVKYHDEFYLKFLL